MEFLKELGLKNEDVQQIMAYDRKYGAAIRQLAQAYMSLAPQQFLKPYPENGRAMSEQRLEGFLAQAKAADPNAGDDYMTNLLFWLHCVPYAREQYREMGISDRVFYDTMKDITYKLEECKLLYGKCGVFTSWFMLHFDWKLAAFGRLQYQIRGFPKEHYQWEGFTLNYGDPVYACHIPSSGKLTRALCMDSLQQAYEFLKNDLKTSVLPVVCNSWLLFPPYAEAVFGEGSNLKAFTELFDIIDQTHTETFEDCWRVFGCAYTGRTDRLPRDTSLRRGLIQYIENGGGFGYGYGVLLYDGEKGKIINCPRP